MCTFTTNWIYAVLVECRPFVYNIEILLVCMYMSVTDVDVHVLVQN